MLTAGITSLLFKLFKQPVVLGYIVAGMMAGPYMFGQSWINNAESVDMWGEIGVLFLLFAMGLEFSFKKLLQVGSTALIAAGTVVVGMMTVGFLLGRLLGWDEINSLFLGGMLCMSSTTIVFKAIEDMNLSSHQFAKVSFGILIVEDLFAIILMVILSSIAVEKQFAGMQLLMEIGKLIAYLILWFVLGIAIIPTFLKRFRRLLNDETLTIFAIGLCLGMVLLAMGAGFSSALGAFVMGSVLAETLEAERIERLIQPIKNVFGSIFFVSVGMMIDPELILHYWGPIIVITLTVIFGQIFFASLGTLLSGQSLKVSLQTGFTLVQIGEFAFIIANFGQSEGVTDSSLYPIVVAVSVITTFLTPFIMRLSGPADIFLQNHLSPDIRMIIDNYTQRKNSLNSSAGIWPTYLRKVITTMLVSGIIASFVFLIYFQVINPFILSRSVWLESLLGNQSSLLVMKIISLVIILAITAPFIYNISSRHRMEREAKALWNSGNQQKAWLAGLQLLRIIIGLLFISYAVVRIFTLTTGMVIGVSVFIIITIMLSRRVKRQSRNMEDRFNQNLTAREISALKKRPVTSAFEHSLLPYDIHISTFTLPVQSSFSGKTLSQLNIRQESGVSIVRIIRGGVFTNIPGGGKHLYPGDQIVVAGTDEQIDRFKQMIDGSLQPDPVDNRTRVTLEHFTLEPGNPLIGTTILDSGIRDQAHCIVMGIKRDEDYIMNPEPSVVFQADDTIIVAGETHRIRSFMLHNN